MSDAAATLAGAGIAAGIIGLCKFVASHKAPAPAPKPTAPSAPPQPPQVAQAPVPQDLPDWINALNGGAPMSEGIRSPEKREWWYL